MRYLIRLGTVQRFYHFCGSLMPGCLLLGISIIAYGVIGGLFLAPPDYQQGEAFRIIYVHVPCALLSLLLYLALAFFSVIFLIWRIKVADMMAYCIAPLGAFYTPALLCIRVRTEIVKRSRIR